ncbi:hypothetical protein [Metamycoplasma auris]|uniref:hypothetical protein n=1 Tax=Metamycoplasma auris TaxID=51363 RepID=UPI0003A4073C|nr:hypothetical protein [Metamycoplasma auris]
MKSKRLLVGFLFPTITLPLVSCNAPGQGNPINTIKPWEFSNNPFKINETNSISNTNKWFLDDKNTLNLTFELIKKEQYELLYPKTKDNEDLIKVARKLNWVLFSILYHKKHNIETKTKNLEDFIQKIKVYKHLLYTNKTLNEEEKAFKSLIENEELLKNLKKPNWYNLDEDYIFWFKNKYWPSYQYFPLSRIKEGDLSSLKDNEKEAIKLQSAEALLLTNFLYPISSLLQTIKEQINFLELFASLNLLILKNKEVFNQPLKEIKDFLKTNLNFEEIKKSLSFIFSLENSSFSQWEEEKTMEISNIFFSPINTKEVSKALFFNDTLMLMDIILNPILSIYSDNNFFEKTFEKQNEWFPKYLYEKLDSNSNITFYHPSFTKNPNENQEKISKYLNHYLNLK